MSDTRTHGQFIWHELMSGDVAASRRFYQQAMGWGSAASPANPDYHLFRHGSGLRGGSMQMKPEQLQQAGRAFWLCYLSSGDIHATVDAARSSGGGVIKEVTDIPGVAKFAVLSDPHGAVFGVYQPSQAHMVDGGYAWHELATSDPDAALQFYNKLFGWSVLRRMNMGAQGSYVVVGIGDRQIGGVYLRQAHQPRSYWLPYAAADEIKAAAKAARSGGAQVMVEPMQVPGGGWITQYADPQGAIFAVHAMAAGVQPAAEPAKQASAVKLAKAKNKSKAKAKSKARVTVKAKAKAKAKSKGKSKRKAKARPLRKSRRTAVSARKRTARRPVRKKK